MKKKLSKFENLRQAVETFIIAQATCANSVQEYWDMLNAANLPEYLPDNYEETTKS